MESRLLILYILHFSISHLVCINLFLYIKIKTIEEKSVNTLIKDEVMYMLHKPN